MTQEDIITSSVTVDDIRERSSDESFIVKDNRRAWLVCFGAFILQVIIVGFLHVWGVFFLHLINSLNASKADIAWAGSAAYGFSMAIGPVTGMLVKKYGCKRITFSGCVICGVSLLLTSFISALWLIYITFSICYGFGMSLAYTPTMTIAQDYFDKYISIATGIMTAGSSTGTLLLSPASNALIKAIGWRHTMRVFAGTTIIAASCTMLFKPIISVPSDPDSEPELPPPSLARNIIEELSIWNNRVFILWSLALTLVMFGYYVPYVHLIAFAKDAGIPESKGSLLVTILGGSTAVGRVIFGKVVVFSCLDRLRMHQLSMIATGTAAMMLPNIKTFDGLVVYVIAVGLVDGCFVVLMPLLTATFVGNDRAVMAWGFVTGASSITFTLGPPVAGWLYDYTKTYTVAFHVCAVPVFAGAVVLLFIPWAIRTSRPLEDIMSFTSLQNLDHVVDEELLLRLSMAAADMFDEPGVKNTAYAEDTGKLLPSASGLVARRQSLQGVSGAGINSQTSLQEPSVACASSTSPVGILMNRGLRSTDSDQIYARKLAHYLQVVEQYKRIMASRKRASSGKNETRSLLASRHSRRRYSRGAISSSKSDYDAKTVRSLEHVTQQLRLTNTSSWLLGGYKPTRGAAVPGSQSRISCREDTYNINPMSVDSLADSQSISAAAAEAANIKQTVDAHIDATLQGRDAKDDTDSESRANESEDDTAILEREKTIQTTNDRVTIVPDVDLTKMPNVDPTKVLTLIVDYDNTKDGNVVDADNFAGINLSKVIALELPGGAEQSKTIDEQKSSATQMTTVEESCPQTSQAVVSVDEDITPTTSDALPTITGDADHKNIIMIPILPKQCPSPVELCTTTTGKRCVRFTGVNEKGLPSITEDSSGESLA